MDFNLSSRSAPRLSHHAQKRKKKQMKIIIDIEQNYTKDVQSQTNEVSEQSNSTNTIQDRAEANIYSEDAVWLCTNLKTGYKTRIHGALAQILKKYPDDYRLSLLSTEEFRP